MCSSKLCEFCKLYFECRVDLDVELIELFILCASVSIRLLDLVGLDNSLAGLGNAGEDACANGSQESSAESRSFL